MTEEPVEALHTLFLDDLLARALTPDKQTGGLVDRKGDTWSVFDFGNRGNGCSREERRKGLAALGRYLAASQLPQERVLLRLDRQYGNGAVLADVAGFACVTRGKDSHPLIQARVHLPPDQVQQRPESQIGRSLSDCPQIPVGVTRKDIVYELFFTNLPQQAMCSSQSRCAPPSLLPLQARSKQTLHQRRATSRRSLEQPGKPGALQERILPSNQMTVGCPAGKRLFPQERRQERDGSLRIVYKARIADCRAGVQRTQCQWHGQENQHPRRVSVVLHPRQGGSAPLLWRDWPRREHRRACRALLLHQQVSVQAPAATPPLSPASLARLSRAQRAHSPLSWDQRQACNARVSLAGPLTLTLYEVPDPFAAFLGLKTE